MPREKEVIMAKRNSSPIETANHLKNRAWFILNIVFTVIYLIWRLFFTLPFEYGVVSMAAGLSLFVVEFLGMLEALIHYFNMHNIQARPAAQIPDALYPDVDVFITTCNEPCDILLKTVNGCVHMDYPDKSRVHIYLCDDGRRAEVRELAERMGVGYLDREEHTYAKAGNLNNALKQTTSPLVVTFDADMVPRREFLMRTVPYFVAQELENEGKEEKDQKHIGFVQTPQAFFNPDLFQFNLYSETRIPNEQDYFYRDIQVSRNKSNSVIYGGSNTVLSRRALEDVGGFYTGTITEDYATGILIQKKKYICVATNEVLASGLSPADLKSLVTQRIRWARGVIASNRKMHVFLTPHLTFAQKVNYWASEWYWYAPLKRLIYFACPILYAVFGFIVFKCSLWQVLLFWLPMYVSSNISLRMLSRNIRSTKWTGIYETVLFPFLLVPILLETFGVHMKKFKVTRKGAVENERGKNLLYMIPFALLVALSVIGIVNCLRLIFESNSLGPVVVLFWLIVNLYTLVMALFFVMGRNQVRRAERARLETDCEIAVNGIAYPCRTSDISETGIAVLCGTPIDLDETDVAEIRLLDPKYQPAVKGKIVYVGIRGEVWKYAFQITDRMDSHGNYLQLIYDRIPTLPQNLDHSSGSFDDLRINLFRRAAKPFCEKRRRPRMILDLEVPDETGELRHIDDFNYQYCTLTGGVRLPELKLTVCQNPEMILDCRLEQEMTQGRTLYRVSNYRQLHDNPQTRQALEAWAEYNWRRLIAGQTAADMTGSETPAENEKKEETFDERNHI